MKTATLFEIVVILVIAFVLWMIRRNVKDEQNNSPVLGDTLDKKVPNRDITTDSE
jgi:ABC-type nickel/cobalt efflux system permease component RcnA